MCYTTLADYYTTIFTMMHHHNYSLADINQLVPYERDLFVDLILDDLEKKKREFKEG